MEYLYQRGSYWYVRIPNTTSAPLPSSLRYSLKTSSLREARHRSRLIVGSIHTMFRDFQTGDPMSKLTPETLNAIIREYVTDTIQLEEHRRATSPRGLDSDSYDDKLLNIEEGIDLLRESLAYGEHAKEMAIAAERAVEMVIIVGLCLFKCEKTFIILVAIPYYLGLSAVLTFPFQINARFPTFGDCIEFLFSHSFS